ncbi:MAG: (2Fe-2S)-binding protein [Corynebacteriales bacterium]|nr:(2Fe-2S)-binding protein [Mycobacteriales bacterium]
MYVCICAQVRESEVRAAIDAGANDVYTVGELCGAGTECGGCHDRIDDLLDAYQPALAPSARQLLPLVAV